MASLFLHFSNFHYIIFPSQRKASAGERLCAFSFKLWTDERINVKVLQSALFFAASEKGICKVVSKMLRYRIKEEIM